MEFLKPKIIVKKSQRGNYILKKKANILLILSLLILFFLIFKGLKKMKEQGYLFNIEYIGTNIVAFLIFFIYLYTILVLFSKETLEFKNREIEIKKYLLFYCFYRKKIKISTNIMLWLDILIVKDKSNYNYTDRSSILNQVTQPNIKP